jgi:hypothetical protein
LLYLQRFEFERLESAVKRTSFLRLLTVSLFEGPPSDSVSRSAVQETAVRNEKFTAVHTVPRSHPDTLHLNSVFSQVVHFLQVFRPKFSVHFISAVRATCPAHTCFVKNADVEAVIVEFPFISFLIRCFPRFEGRGSVTVNRELCSKILMLAVGISFKCSPFFWLVESFKMSRVARLHGLTSIIL